MAPRKSGSPTKAELQKKEKNDRVLWSAILFAIGILVMSFALIEIESESAWNSIHNIFLGLFGVTVFIVPVILIYVSVIIALDKSERTVEGKVVQCFIMIFLLCGFIQIVFEGTLHGKNIFNEVIPSLYEEGKELRGGGVFSILLAGPLLALFKKTGATIIIILLIFVFVMLMTNKTVLDLLKAVKRLFSSAFSKHPDYAQTEDFIPPPGAKTAKAKAKNEKPAAPNIDVPEKIAAEKQKGFNIDIPIHNKKSKTADMTDGINTAGTVSPADIFTPPFSLDEKPAGLTKNTGSDVFDEVSAGIENSAAPADLSDIIKKAALAPESKEKKSFFAPKADAKLKLKKQSTLASNKIQTDDELDMPDAPTAADIQHEIIEQQAEIFVYKFPPVTLLRQLDNSINAEEAEAEMKNNADTLVDTLKSFGVQTRIVDIHRGPTVTRYELQPSAGVKVSKITGLSDDIALNLAAAGVRIEAPIPGKAAVGVEVPNKVKDIVTFRELIESREFAENNSKLTFVVGRNIDGDVIIGDIAKMPHVIIAGTTGSGKSVCTNSIIMSILYNASPDEVRLVLIDPKMVEFKTYDGIPHLLIPVVIDPRKAAGALSWAVQEMLKRYKLFSDCNVRDLNGYNEMASQNEGVEPLPRIVIAIDELADLMMAAAKEVEDSICRLAQMARAAGMHLIIATQRPTVDVITGLIKANIPSRIALTVSSQIDSRTIIDTAGAEKLLGNGDMLYYPSGIPKPVRVQGCFCSVKEVEAVVEFIKNGGTASYDSEIIDEIEKNIPVQKGETLSLNGEEPGGDSDIIDQAVDILTSGGQASISFLQRRLKLGFARAARVMDELEELGVVGPNEGAKPRQVLISREMWLQRKLINQDRIDI